VENRNLWAPWRSLYVGAAREPGCIFCLAGKEEENPERLVVGSSDSTLLVMNRYPYATGHVMVTPRRHVGVMEELTGEEVMELWRLAVKAKGALTSLYNPDGFNLGFNLGEAAGAGITDHLHLHVVPRWRGDTNFMPVLADVRVMPQHLEEIRLALLAQLGARST